MAKTGGKARNLKRIMDSHIQNIEDTLQILDKPALSSFDKVDWSEVTKLGDEISKQATIAGMLWNGEARGMKELEENLDTYINILNGFLLICHGSTVGAGPTLHESIRTSAKQVVDCSLSLLRQGVSIYDSCSNSTRRLTIPQLSGSVWEACDTLKKVPTTNCKAIVRVITKVAISVKDVVREMKELESTPEDCANPDVGTSSEANSDQLEDTWSDDNFGDDLSPEEMLIARLVSDVATNSLESLKELIRYVKNINMDTDDFTLSLERLRGYCQEIGSHINELGACVYPPQEILEMKALTKQIRGEVSEIRREVENIGSSKEELLIAFQGLQASLGKLDSGLGVDVVSTGMEGLTL